VETDCSQVFCVLTLNDAFGKIFSTLFAYEVLMDLANGEIRKINEQIQQEKDSTRLLALVAELMRLLDQQQASMNRVPLTDQEQETQRAGMGR
jgi:hypothetical protein